jgi:hypothetical protein
MVDRSAEHASALEAWRSALGPLPALAPGELLQL